MRILGIDPGLLHTGWAVIDARGGEHRYVASGVILPKTSLELSARLATIFRGVDKLCDDFAPFWGTRVRPQLLRWQTAIFRFLNMNRTR